MSEQPREERSVTHKPLNMPKDRSRQIELAISADDGACSTGAFMSQGCLAEVWKWHAEEATVFARKGHTLSEEHHTKMAQIVAASDAEITRLHAEVERLRTQLDKIEALDDHPSLSGNERTRLVRRIEDKKPELAVEMVWEYATEKCAEWAIAMAATPPAQQHTQGDTP